MGRKCGFFVLLLIGVLFAGQNYGFAEGSPRAVVRSPSWDFGYLPQKSEVSHLFYLYNTGSAPLSVTKIESGCSCTSVSELDHPIAPGDSAAIVVTFKSGRYRHRVKKTTKIHTDDPETPVCSLRILANVVKRKEATGDVWVRPPKLTWRINKTIITVDTNSLKISNNGMDSLAVAVLHVPEGIVDRIESPERVAPGQEVELQLRPSKELIPGKTDGLSITLAFAGRETTIVTVPIEMKD